MFWLFEGGTCNFLDFDFVKVGGTCHNRLATACYPKFKLDYSALWKVAMRILRVFEDGSWLGLWRLLVT